MLAAAALQLAIPSHALFAQADKNNPASKEVDYNQVFAAGVADFNANKNFEAAKKFQQVLSRHPNHVHSKRYLSMIRQRLREDAAIPVMKKRLAKIKVKELEFQDATLSEVMEYVTAKAKELSKGEVKPGLVIRGGDPVRDRELSFKTGEASLADVIDTTAKLTNTTVQYTEFALIFTSGPTAEELEAERARQLEAAEAKERARAAAEAAANDPFRRRR